MVPPSAGGGPSPGRRWLLRLGFDLRPGETLPTGLLFLAFFLLIAFEYAAKSVRQSTFVDSLGATRLPYVYLLVAVASYPLAWAYARVADRARHHHLIAASGAVVALTTVVFWWLFRYSWAWVPVAFYVWLAIAGALTVSQFWSFAGHVFDPRQAKRLFGLLGAGGLLGGIAGGQLARLATAAVGTRYALLVAAGLLGAMSVLILIVHRLHPVAEAQGHDRAAGSVRLERARGGFAVLRGSRHLRLIALLVVATIAVAQIVDVQFSWAAEQATSTLDQRTAFFGNFYSVMGLAAFVFQILFTSRIHRWLGIGFAMRVLPTAMGLGTVALLLAAGLFPTWLLAAAIALKIGDGGLRYSLDQATRELLFLPVPAAVRVKAKAFIDVVVQRGAKGVAAFLLLPVALGVVSPVDAGWLALAVVAGWLALTFAVRQEYVAAFRQGLRRRSLDKRLPIDLSDATTLELLVQALGSLDPRQVLHGLELLEAHGRGHLVPPLLLYHDDPAVRRRTLEVLAREQRRDAAPLIARRLGDVDADVRAQAVLSLADLEGRDVVELMRDRVGDADAGVRAAAVACFANHGGEQMAGEAARLLGDLLSDGDPAVRREGAKAIGAIAEPRFRDELVALLYDVDPSVVVAAIAAVCRRTRRGPLQPLYVPCLVSLLRRRRLKHEAREALVAYGPSVVPALAHFMTAEDEPLWVRRAIPKTLALVDGPAAVAALVHGLQQARDPFLRGKLVEALASLPERRRSEADPLAVTAEIHAEVREWVATASLLRGLGAEPADPGDASAVSWTAEASPTLLPRLLAGRLDGHVANVFGLLGVLHQAAAMKAAGRDLASLSAAARSHALEYLDNTLERTVKRWVFLVIGDEPLDERLARGRQLLGLNALDRAAALEALIAGAGPAADGEGDWLAAAAIYDVHVCGDELHPLVTRCVAARDPLVRETAEWVLARASRRSVSTAPREVIS